MYSENPVRNLMQGGATLRGDGQLALADIDRLMDRLRQPARGEVYKQNPMLAWRSTDRTMRPCDCETCARAYISRGVVSPHRASSCPHRNKLRDLRFIRDLNKPKRTEPFKTIVDLKVDKEVAPFDQADWDRAMKHLGSRWNEEMHGAWRNASYSTGAWPSYISVDDLRRITKEKTSPFLEMMRSTDKAWYGTDQRDAIKAGIGRLAGRIETAMADREYAGEVERVMRRELDAYQWPYGEQCNLKSQGESMPSSISASRLADEVRQLGRDNTDLSAIKKAIDRAEAERKDLVVSALRSIARLEKSKNRREGKEFVLAYQHDGDEYIVHGVDFAYGKAIDEDEISDEYRVFLHEPEGIDYEYYTMKMLEDALKHMPYAIEYLD